ncbi:MAG TPA: SDR family oxidoreductase [Polyangiales bacterium]|jgi:NAD(P)-dependent dehydrogenase (short-subunit alcohol dehydrogenase family)|nr:SDR family oxidoreductase [Polyangiales bacterium]
MDIEGKVIVVTGGSSGIGRALCERFHAEGAKGICVADVQEEPGRVVAKSVDGLFVRCDVRHQADIEAVVKQSEERFGPIDLFCSNAGIGLGDEGVYGMGATPEQWQRIWEINVMAHVHAANAVLPSMLKRGRGYLLQTSSAAGLLSQIGSASYSTTKHAAIGLAESLAIAYGDSGIKVSVLCPQGVKTAMTAGQGDTPQAGDGMLEPEAVAESVVQALAKETFLILPHPEVATYMQRKASDYDRWIAGMQRFRRKFVPA